MARLLIPILTINLLFGMVVKRGDRIVLREGEEIDDDIIIFARTVEIRGLVNGDVLVLAQKVEITGDVDGTIFLFAGDIDIDVIAARSVLAGGGTITLSGDIINNVVLMGGNVSIAEAATIGKDLRLFCGGADIDGEIEGMIKASAGKIIMGGSCQRMILSASDVTITSTAKIDGDLIVRGRKKPNISTGATIGGETKWEPAPSKRPFFTPLIASILRSFRIVFFIARIIFGLVMILLLRQYLVKVTGTLLTRPWHSLGWGFLSLIAIPVLVVILFITLVGFPFAFLGIYIYTILIFLSPIIVGLVVGEYLIRLLWQREMPHPIPAFLLGFILLFLFGLIPYLGLLIRIGAILFGSGALLLTTWGLIREARMRMMI
ncbi:hypothetical protein DRP53_04005 [candidate division WOR-3 bacterium]|uniref:DUF8173 domain-containing protein n=1 Tax=candidate division WOR-3 bacterium TaxID=2052148 RepID=A0A660SKT7_UNCW3|nr:MAG: hypothetical protein DRP53_04005 [candidate division WOR-3 bacterium]